MTIPQMIGNMSVQQMLNNLQRQNPMMYQMVQNAMKNGVNPTDLFRQVTKGYSKEQLDNLFTQAKQYGISEDTINQVRY
jgi:hypothetical protein